MEAARAMLHYQDLPMHLWAEAAKTTMYVQNHTPHRVLENKTLEEVFSGKKLEVNHLRIFGCLVYIHIPREKRTKIDPSGKKGIFVGYSDSSNAYRIYFLGFKKINIFPRIQEDRHQQGCNMRRRFNISQIQKDTC